jgi:hypothetical protein
VRTYHPIPFIPAAFLIFLTLSSAGLSAQKPTQEEVTFFESKIRPLLAAHCLECHSAEKGKIKGGLNLDSKPDWSKGGESGAVIAPGNVKESLLVRAVSWDGDLQMPPKRMLETEQIEDLKRWIAMGAPDPREPSANASKFDKTNHWAFQPFKKPAIPSVKNPGWAQTPVDLFVLAQLDQKQMLPATPASKEVLLRRAYFDLIGLPPKPRQIHEFLKDSSPDAFARVVEELLADPGYGERWARHWLDTARYSDTTGLTGNNRNNEYHYPYAWSYREWVINALNADMPYDQFLINQLAADRVPNNDKSNLAALGFLLVGQRFSNNDDTINERIDVVGRGMLGLTIACARCHDHKFDPITSADYYALRGIFQSTIEPREGPLIGGDPNSQSFLAFQKRLEALERHAVNAFYAIQRETGDRVRKNAAAMFEYLLLSTKDANPEETTAATALLKRTGMNDREIRDTMGRHFRADDHFLGPFIQIANSATPEAVILKLRAANSNNRYSPRVIAFLSGQRSLPKDRGAAAALAGRFFSELERQIPSLFAIMTDKSRTVANYPMQDDLEWASFPLPMVMASNLTTQRIEEESRRWGRLGGALMNRAQLSKINHLKLTTHGGPVRAMVLEDSPSPVNSPLFVRGNPPKPGENPRIVPRRFLDVLSSGGRAEPFQGPGSGRYELALAIANKANPLTARVIVNRVWMHHFGEGLVRTPDDLGNQAGRPTHPELLDYITEWFVTDFGPSKPAWSLKALHRLLMLSRVYQQSSTSVFKKNPAGTDYEKIDPGNTLLWRANIRRLDFEAFRDSMLSMGGVLSRKIVGGPSFNVTEEPIVPRRSLYAYIDRGSVPDVLMHFDMANPDQPNSKRSSTIVPQQALYLMNSPFAAFVVQHIVKRPELVRAVLVDKNTNHGISMVFQILLQRFPTAHERQMALKFLVAENKAQDVVEKDTKKIAEAAAKLASQKLAAAQNSNDARRAIVNEGDIVQRATFSPWEALVQCLLFTNESAYVY